MEITGITNLERELKQLRVQIIEMMELVCSQIEKAEKAFITQDIPLSKEIHHLEKMVNAADVNIDKECENLIALYNPVASDLRFILASTKIISHLERVGDHADKIARYVRKKQVKKAYQQDLLKAVKLELMFDLVEEMLEMATEAFTEENSALAREVFEKDILINDIYSNAILQINEYAEKENPQVQLLIYLFSVVNKLERVGDLAKNIAEQTIFYLEAKILRHRKLKKKKKSGRK